MPKPPSIGLSNTSGVKLGGPVKDWAKLSRERNKRLMVRLRVYIVAFIFDCFLLGEIWREDALPSRFLLVLVTFSLRLGVLLSALCHA